MEFDKSPNLKYQAVTINSAKENCGNPQKFYIELIKVLFLHCILKNYSYDTSNIKDNRAE